MKKIMIIDDEKSFTRTLRLALLKKYIVNVENDSTQAIYAIRKFKPDLILLDVIMPGIDGGTLATQIQSEHDINHIPIIFLTAIVKKNEEGTIGGNLFIAKPVSEEKLVNIIEQHI